MDSYEDKLRREQDWYEAGKLQQDHVLNSRLFYSRERVDFSDKFLRTQFAAQVRQVLDRAGFDNPRLLVAPSGAGFDLPYLLPLSNRIAVIDISQAALDAIPDGSVEKHLGDIKHMSMFKDGSFDVIIMSQFFHHFVKFGFDEFLLEARRVLQPGGHFFSLEPSILHPFALAAWCVKRCCGNITGCVEDETPFFPGRLLRAMKRCGFGELHLWAASYSHQRMPIPAARMIHALTRPLLKAPLFPYAAWGCTFYGRKPLKEG